MSKNGNNQKWTWALLALTPSITSRYDGIKWPNSMLNRLSNILSSFTPGTSSSKDLPYKVDDENFCAIYPWTVCRGTRQSDGVGVTILRFDTKDKNESEIRSAQVGHIKLRTMKHPNILKYIDGTETPDTIQVVTEDAIPLKVALQEDTKQFFMKYGLLQLLRSIDFLSNNCGIVHGNIGIRSVFVDSASEWKLAGLEYSHAAGEPPPPKPASLSKYDPPEAAKGGSKKTPVYSTDMWGLGVLIYEVYNGELQHTSDLRNTRKIPKDLVPHYCTLVSANPNSRPNPKDLLEEMRAHGGYLSDPMISIAVGAEELHVMEATQRKNFLDDLNKRIASFPKSFCTQKLLTCLLNTFEFSNAGTTILEPLFKIAQYLENDEYQAKIVPCVVKLFSSTDRATRIQLLQKMGCYVEHIRTTTASNDIFPSVALGFTDTVQAVREETVKSMVLLAPKLNGNILNNQLLKYLAKLQMDEVPSIRTNTTIVISKIASHLDKSTQQRVLSSAFLRGIRDPFVPAKLAALGGLCATSSLYTPQDMATKVVPAVSPVLIDPNKEVREKGFSTLELFMKVMREVSNGMTESTDPEGHVSSNTWSWASFTSALYKAGGSTQKDNSASSSERAQESRGENDKDADKGTFIESKQDCGATEGAVLPQNEWQTGRTDAWEKEDETWESFEMGGKEKSQTTNVKDIGGNEGWDDWTEEFDVQESSSSEVPKLGNISHKKEPVQLFTMKEDSSTKGGMSSSGWDEGWSDDWSDPFSKVSSSKPPNQSHEVDTRQQRQEERRKRQEAARQKRAAGHGGKPKLGSKGD